MMASRILAEKQEIGAEPPVCRANDIFVWNESGLEPGQEVAVHADMIKAHPAS